MEYMPLVALTAELVVFEMEFLESRQVAQCLGDAA